MNSFIGQSLKFPMRFPFVSYVYVTGIRSVCPFTWKPEKMNDYMIWETPQVIAVPNGWGRTVMMFTAALWSLFFCCWPDASQCVIVWGLGWKERTWLFHLSNQELLTFITVVCRRAILWVIRWTSDLVMVSLSLALPLNKGNFSSFSSLTKVYHCNHNSSHVNMFFISGFLIQPVLTVVKCYTGIFLPGSESFSEFFLSQQTGFETTFTAKLLKYGRK